MDRKYLNLLSSIFSYEGIKNAEGKDDAPIVRAKDGYLKLALRLVQGANVNARDGEHLIGAARSGSVEALKYLVSQGADIKTYGKKALHVAIKHGYYYYRLIKDERWARTIRYLLSLGVVPDFKDDDTLALAAAYGRIDIMKYLLDMGKYEGYPVLISGYKEARDRICQEISRNPSLSSLIARYY